MIQKEMSQRLSSKDEEFLIDMKIIEADGSSKDRQMHIWRMSPNKKNHYFMVRMLKPEDLRGTAVLATLKSDQQEKWIYLPSSKQTRRLTGENNQGGILGSELSAEDFDFSHEQSSHSQIKKEIESGGKKLLVIDTDVNKSSANYSRIVSYVSTTDFLPIKVECFDKQNHLLKTLDINDYVKVTDSKWRASKIKIQNIQNKRGTEIVLSKIKINQKLKSSQFTPRSLSQD